MQNNVLVIIWSINIILIGEKDMKNVLKKFITFVLAIFVFVGSSANSCNAMSNEVDIANVVDSQGDHLRSDFNKIEQLIQLPEYLADDPFGHHAMQVRLRIKNYLHSAQLRFSKLDMLKILLYLDDLCRQAAYPERKWTKRHLNVVYQILENPDKYAIAYSNVSCRIRIYEIVPTFGVGKRGQPKVDICLPRLLTGLWENFFILIP